MVKGFVNKFSQAKDLSGYFLKAKTKYSIHSPFVYDLVTKVFENQEDDEAYIRLEDYRSRLLKNREEIDITDLGVGSKKGLSNRRGIRDIAKLSLTRPKYVQMLYRLAMYMNSKCILELGTCLGLTTMYLALANRKSTVYAIEGCPKLFEFANNQFKHEGIQNVKSLNGHFELLLPSLLEEINSLSFVYIDGNHQKEATLKYFNLCLNKINENSVIVFDDINWSSGMKEAWKEIKNNKMVTISIDLYQMGLVFFHKRQPKQNFIVRF